MLQMHSKDFLKFCTMKGAKRHMKFIFVIFAKKILLRVNGLLWAKNAVSTGSALKDLLIILHNERGE